MASIGDKLTAPESGWRRYDDDADGIVYEPGKWAKYSAGSGEYKGSSMGALKNKTAKMEFHFIGTKVMIITNCSATYSRDIAVKIDGVQEGILECYMKTQTQTVAFIKEGLPFGNHKVEIEITSTPSNVSTYNVRIDAIDVDDTGRISHENEVDTIEKLEVGKKIRCNYFAKTSNVGVLSGIGKETDSLLPVQGSATPSGDFFFVAAENADGSLKLIPDRVIQHSLAADTINSTLMLSGLDIRDLYHNDRSKVTSIFRFNELASNFVDTVGSAVATLAGNPGSVVSPSGKAIQFDGIDDNITFDTSLMPASGPYGFRIRFKTEQPSPTGARATIVLLDSNGWDYNRKGLYCFIHTDGTLRVDHYAGNQLGTYLGSKVPVNDGEWHEVLFEWTGDTSPNGMKLYVDDMTKPHSQAAAAFDISQCSPAAYKLRMGMSHSTAQEIVKFKGEVDLFEVYSGITNPAEQRYLVLHDNVYKKWIPGGPGIPGLNILDDMTSASTAKATVSDSGHYAADRAGWKAFDGNPNTAYYTYRATVPQEGHHLLVELTTPQSLSGVRLHPGRITSGVYGLADFQVFGSTNGVDFDLVTYGSHANVEVPETYKILDNRQFSHIKFLFTSSHHATTGMTIMLNTVELLSEPVPGTPGNWVEVTPDEPTDDTYLNDSMSEDDYEDANNTGAFSLLTGGFELKPWSNYHLINPFHVAFDVGTDLWVPANKPDHVVASVETRLMSGGKNEFDQYNEWDTLIVNNVLNGTQAGLNEVWNWLGVGTLTSTIPQGVVSGESVSRGNLTVDARASIPDTLASPTVGFRPIIHIHSAAGGGEDTLGTLYEIESGLIFVDDFMSLNSRWTGSPVGSISITDKPSNVRLKHHGSQDTLLLATIPYDTFAFEVMADYTPTQDGDEGGIILWNNSSDKLEFLESVDSNKTESQANWMAVLEDGEWNLYSDSGQGYDFVDTSNISASRFGVVLKRGVASGYVPLDVDMIIATKGDKLTIVNVSQGQKVRIRDIDGNILAEDIVGDSSKIKLKLPYLEVEGSIEVLNEDGILQYAISGIFHGGDIYSVGSILQIRKDGVELSRVEQTTLGDMRGGTVEALLELYNPYKTSVSNIELSIAQYSDKFGWEWADLSMYTPGVAPVYGDTLSVGNLPSGRSVPFVVKVERGQGGNYDKIQFNVVIDHD